MSSQIFHLLARSVIASARLYGLLRRPLALGIPLILGLAGEGGVAAWSGLGLIGAGELLVWRWLYRRSARAPGLVLAGASLSIAGALLAALALGGPAGAVALFPLLFISALMPALPFLETVRWQRAHPAVRPPRAPSPLAGMRADHPTGLPPGPAPILARPVIHLIRAYREVSPAMPDRTCCHEPSCSRYAEAALARHGLLRGLGLAVARVLRCSPASRGGYDPPPT